jgi:hypothetical protein
MLRRVDRLAAQIAVALGAFGAGVAVAELFGADSLGIAFGFGQLTFVVACGWLLLLRDR